MREVVEYASIHIPGEEKLMDMCVVEACRNRWNSVSLVSVLAECRGLAAALQVFLCAPGVARWLTWHESLCVNVGSIRHAICREQMLLAHIS